MMTGLHEWDSIPSTIIVDKVCPECRSKMEITQVFEWYGDFIDDGPYHWEWRCKCGHAEPVK